MNDLAGQRIELKKYTGDYTYDYIGKDYSWQAGWLKDIREEKEPVDWSKVPVDAKVMIKDYIKTKQYFAKYENGKVYTWNYGCTSWTAEKYRLNDTSLWLPNQVELVEEDEK